ncbi:MAG: ribbon-helix-helix domain-containing protein [Dehalococcoidia bacterium]
MKASVSLPAALLSQAGEAAKALGISRDQLFREAIAEFLIRHHPGSVTA